MIHDEAALLASQGQMIYLTIATDGLPTTRTGSNDNVAMVEQLKLMASSLPVQMVIRLCTDDANVVSFYNRLDEEYELPLDILDDFQSEAQEINNAGNGFFVYTPIMHRIREAGTLFKLLDAIDEQKFSPLEMRKFIELISDSAFAADTDNRSFVAQAAHLAQQRKPIFDPISGKMQPYLNVQEIKRNLKVGFRANFRLCF